MSALKINTHVVVIGLLAGVIITFVVYMQIFGSKEFVLEKEQMKAQRMLEALGSQMPTPEQLESVIKVYRGAIEKSPLSSQAARIHFIIARLYAATKNFDKSYEELKKIILDFSRNADFATEAQFQMGKIHEFKNEWDEAYKTYKEIVEQYPLSSKGLYMPLYIAESYKARGLDAEAQEAYASALKHYDQQKAELGEIAQAAILVNYAALTYASQELWTKAIEQWQRVITEYPKGRLVPPTLMTLGEVYFTKLKERTKAVECYVKIVTDYPEDQLARQASVRLVQLYFSTSDFENARIWCRKILDDQKNAKNEVLLSEISLLVARAYEKEGNWSEAEKQYEMLRTAYPKSAAAMRVPLIKARHFQEENNLETANTLYQEAMVEYQRVVSEQPNTEVAINAQDLISLIYISQNDWNGLVNYLDTLIAQSAQMQNRQAQLLFLKGNIFKTKLNNNAVAKQTFKDFLAKYPQHPLASTVQKQLEAVEKAEALVANAASALSGTGVVGIEQPVENKDDEVLKQLDSAVEPNATMIESSIK